MGDHYQVLGRNGGEIAAEVQSSPATSPVKEGDPFLAKDIHIIDVLALAGELLDTWEPGASSCEMLGIAFS